MRNRATAAFLVVLLAGLIPTAGLALTPYSQDFELLVQTDPNALANDGWKIFGNVYNPAGDYLYGYGVFPAPNHNLAFSQITLLEGGVEQGLQQLSIFSDYENADHAVGNLIESNVFQEWTIDAGAVGQTWRFQFDAKKGNLIAPTTALAFIKTIELESGNFFATNFVTADMTDIPTEWGTYFIDLQIIPELVGQLIQIGFACTATNFDSSGIIYDNLFWFTGVSSVPDASAIAGASMKQNFPNPFNPMTRIDFALEKSQMVDVSVFDLAGRRVATLHRGELGVGDHHVIWDGKNDAGRNVAAGQYRYVLKTASGSVSRSMTLLK